MHGMGDLIIQNGRVVTPDGVVDVDILVTKGRISGLARRIDVASFAAAQVIDAAGLWVMPGGVDPHCHIEQLSGMGVMNADTFETATRAALMGGTTTVISFAAQQKHQPLRDIVADYAARAQRGAMCDYAFHLSVSDTDADGFDTDIPQLIEAGHRSVKVFTTYNIRLDDAQILRVMAAAKAHGALVCVHAENHGMIEHTKNALLAAGLTAPKYHAPSHPRMAEVEAVSRMIYFAEFLACPVMLFHISTREALDLIRAARNRGVPIWAETCPHYLLMDHSILDQDGIEGAKWMCSPPQRRTDDQDALWSGLRDGDIDLVSSDHAPYRMDESGKLSNGTDARFDQIANGLPGLETRLPLMFDQMVVQGRGGAEAFARATSQRPAEIYGLDHKGRIELGMDADFTLWDSNGSRVFGANDLHDNVGYNPWEGRTVQGAIAAVILRGDVVVENGRFRGQAGSGQWIARDAIGATTHAPQAEELQLIGTAQT